MSFPLHQALLGAIIRHRNLPDTRVESRITPSVNPTYAATSRLRWLHTPLEDRRGLTADPGSDHGARCRLRHFSFREHEAEAEFPYTKAAWDLGSGGRQALLTSFNLGANFLYDMERIRPPRNSRLGSVLVGLSSTRLASRVPMSRFCVDADLDDWNVQGILGGSYQLSETGVIVVRYRMQNIGGFSSENRLSRLHRRLPPPLLNRHVPFSARSSFAWPTRRATVWV